MYTFGKPHKQHVFLLHSSWRRAPNCALLIRVAVSNLHLPASRRTPNKVAKTRRRILSQIPLGGETSDQMNAFRRRQGGQAAAEEAHQTRIRSSSRLADAEVGTKPPQSESLLFPARLGMKPERRNHKAHHVTAAAHRWHFHNLDQFVCAHRRETSR